jgi:hypothetical protein
MMKIFNIALVSLAALCGLAAAPSADANGRHHHSRAHVGIWFGAPVFPYYSPYYYPRYYYPPAYYPPAYYPPAVAAPPVYIEQSTAPAAPAPAAPSAQNSTAYWYYCPDSQTYYPYVQQCASPWQQVVPQSTPPG